MHDATDSMIAMKNLTYLQIGGDSDKHSKLDLCGNDIHLWFTKPNYPYEKCELDRYKGLLTKEEASRHACFKFEKDRHNFLVRRIFIRDVLSHYSETPPHLWQFKVGTHGKPGLQNSLKPLSFNLSHTDDLIICAVTLYDAIGCDVENMNRYCEYLDIAECFFTRGEFDQLLYKSGNDQRNCFYDYWTLKESFIKACGQGLTIPLNDFQFEIGPSKWPHGNDNIRLHFASGNFGKAEHWRSWLFCPTQDHKVAISVKSQSEDQSRTYSFRFWENIPLIKTLELT